MNARHPNDSSDPRNKTQKTEQFDQLEKQVKPKTKNKTNQLEF